jgi:hypothetical protein
LDKRRIVSSQLPVRAESIKLSQDAENSMVARRRHRNVALTSIGVSTVSGLAMWIANR